MALLHDQPALQYRLSYSRDVVQALPHLHLLMEGLNLPQNCRAASKTQNVQQKGLLFRDNRVRNIPGPFTLSPRAYNVWHYRHAASFPHVLVNAGVMFFHKSPFPSLVVSAISEIDHGNLYFYFHHNFLNVCKDFQVRQSKGV